MNKAFNDLHKQNKMHWTKKSSFFAYSVFIMWKISVFSQRIIIRKKRIIINIYELNKILKKNFYLLFLQLNITASVWEALYIFKVNYTDFFYQWWIKSEDFYKLTVMIHQSQKSFNIAVMKYSNSSSHIQH